MNSTERLRPFFKQGPRGVTLIEVLISIVMLLVVWITLVGLLRSVSMGGLSLLNETEAHRIGDQIHQHIRKKDFHSLRKQYLKFPQINQDGKFKVQVQIGDILEDKTRSAIITVQWENRGQTKKISIPINLIQHDLPN